MMIVGGLDLHRKEITFAVVVMVKGACRRGPVPRRNSFRWLLDAWPWEGVYLVVWREHGLTRCCRGMPAPGNS